MRCDVQSRIRDGNRVPGEAMRIAAALPLAIATAVVIAWLAFKSAYPGETCFHRPYEWAIHEGCLTFRSSGVRP